MEHERRYNQDEMLGRIAAIGESNSQQLTEIRVLLDKYVTKEEFNPVRNIVFGMVGLILVGCFITILKLVYK